MTTNLTIPGKYCWRGVAVHVKHSEGDVAFAMLEGSSVVIPVKLSELKPLATSSELLSPAMKIPEAEWERGTALAEALRKVLELPEGKSQAIADIASRFDLSERRVYTILKAYQADPSPFTCMRGKPGRHAATRVLQVRVELIIAACLEKYYATAEKPSVQSAYEHLAEECKAAGLKPPSLNTVRNRIAALELADRIKAREGRKRAKEICEPATGHVAVSRPLQRVEIDHTLVDVNLVAATRSRELLGRPWITLAIDYYTRMVLGFYVSFDRPSSKSVALCLAHAILPKDEWLKRMGLSPELWAAFGFFEELWVDNAMEFRAVALQRGCAQHSMQLCYRPPGEPQVGGAIERLIGTTMGRVHLLPGTTQSNPQARGDYDSEAQAQLTPAQFLNWLTYEIVTRYHTVTHSTLGKPPIIAWREAVADKVRQPPACPEEVLASFLPGELRVLRRTGIELNRMRYWSPALSPWVGQRKKVVVHQHPWDPQHAYVRAPNGELVTARATRAEALSDKTVTDHLMSIAEDAKLQDTPELAAARTAGHNAKREILEASAEAKRLSRKTHNALPAPSPTRVQLQRPAAGLPLSVRGI